jgi:hypothetical protein
MNYEIGDRFFIIDKPLLLKHIYKDNSDFIKSGLSVYYEDNGILKSIGISGIELVSTRRDQKLKKLGI